MGIWTKLKKLVGLDDGVQPLAFPEQKQPKRTEVKLDDNVVITRHGLQKVSVKEDCIEWDTKANTTKQVRAVPELTPDDMALIEERELDPHKAQKLKTIWAAGNVSAKLAASMFTEGGFCQSSIAKYWAVFNAAVGQGRSKKVKV